jgi:hypothetical protein
MNERVELGEARSLFRGCLRAEALYVYGVLACLYFADASVTYGQQVVHVPPFIGSHSETWERFGFGFVPNGTSILEGIATISGTDIETAPKFQMCTVHARPSDGSTLMDSDRPSGPDHFLFPAGLCLWRLLG